MDIKITKFPKDDPETRVSFYFDNGSDFHFQLPESATKHRVAMALYELILLLQGEDDERN